MKIFGGAIVTCDKNKRIHQDAVDEEHILQKRPETSKGVLK